MSDVMDGVMMLWRARLRQHVRSLVFLTLLVAVGGGAALACIAGARRTASSFDRIAIATDFPQIVSSHLEEPNRAVAVAGGLDGVTSFRRRSASAAWSRGST
ncbi:MAG: hypothetical protein ACR2HP_07765 [Ilumatobacteraceae bacterium]